MSSPLSDRRERPWLVARQVGVFVAVGLLAVILVGFGTLVASRRVGEREAIIDARTTTLNRSLSVVEPAVTDGLVTADPDAVARIGAVVERYVLDDNLVRVKIWTADGLIVYSDEPRLQGTRFALGEDERSAITEGLILAEVTNLDEPENLYERDQGKLLAVYLPIVTPGGQRLLFEAYYRYDAVTANADRIWRSFAPIAIGALVALELVQIPLAWSLARRLRQRQLEREGLLNSALDASDTERRRIATDLHDGVVQELAGVAFTLAGAARAGPREATDRDLLERSAAEVRGSMTALRSLLADIYPPDMDEEGMVPLLGDLLARVEAAGVATSLDASGLTRTLPAPVARLVYRAAQEALRNVVTHAQATEVVLSVVDTGGCAVLIVTDDGVGFDPTARSSDGSAHFGLRGLTRLAEDAGGQFRVTAAPARGTTIRLEVPLG